MQKIQKFGGAMFTPVLLFAFAGIVIGIGTLFTTETIMGSLAAPSSMWYKCWNVLLQGGWTVFNQLPLLFVVGLPIGMAKKQNARCCMEALVLYLTFHYFLSTSHHAHIQGFYICDHRETACTADFLCKVNSEDSSPLGKVMIPVAVLAALLWPKIQLGMFAFQGFVKGAGALGIWVFVFLERALIPFGLHHILYSPFYYDNVVVPGGLYAYWATKLPEIAASSASLKSLVPMAGFTSTGFSKIFGCPGIALAFYSTAKKEKKKKNLGLLIPITLTAIFCGVTEPIEFTFLFVAPVLFVVHALLAATLSTTMYLAGIVGIHSGGAIEMASLNWIPLMGNHWKQYLFLLVIGLAFTGIYFVVFKFLIQKFDFKTPGREDDDEIKFGSKEEFREKKGSKQDQKIEFAQLILEGLGGKDNIEDVTNCATRLRVNVKDETLCKDDPYFKSIGAHGCSVNGKSFQVIIGLKVAGVRDDFESLL